MLRVVTSPTTVEVPTVVAALGVVAAIVALLALRDVLRALPNRDSRVRE